MKKFNLIIALIVISSFFGVSGNAQVFNLTTGTGAVGANDPIWTMRLPPSATAFNPVRISTGMLQNGGAPFNAYVQNNCGRWISPWLDPANNIIAAPGTPGIFTYRMQFVVGNCVINPTAFLNLNFMAADNLLTAVRVNGVAQTIPGGITHTSSGAMTSTPTVTNGLNTIEVDVRNHGAYTALQLCGNITVSGRRLGVPRNLNCCSAQNRNLLSWNPVPGVTGYQVEIVYNDPACCRGGADAYGVVYPVTENILLFNPTNCYSWRVRAVNGSCFSDWSERKCGCFNNLQGGVEPEPGPQSMVRSNNNNTERLHVDEVMTSINPNPADNVVTVNIANPTGTLKTEVCELSIVNLSGVEVLRESVQLNVPKEIKVDGLKPGLYICKIVAEGRVVSTTKLAIK